MIVTANGLHVSLRDPGTDGWRGDRAAFFQVFFSGEYDFLLSRISHGNAIIDAGANIGCFALLASRSVGPQGLVIAVEPEPANVACLRRNIALNHAANIIVVERALDSVSDKTVHIFGSGAMARIDETGTAVQTTTLDQLLKDLSIQKVEAIKMDIEGAENSIFANSATSTALGTARVIAVEVHNSEGLVLALSRFQAERYTYISPVKLEADFLIASLLRAASRPYLVMRLYRNETVAVVTRLFAGAIKERRRSSLDILGLVYAAR